MLCYSKDGLYTSLTTLPSEALQTEALKLFKVKGERSPVPPTAGGRLPCVPRLCPKQFRPPLRWEETHAGRGSSAEGS